MLDLFHIPVQRICDVQVFRTGTVNNGDRSWVKPRGCSNVFIFLAGAGAGGQGGFQAASGQRGGGGGGGGAAILVGLIQSIIIPDFLLVTLGAGGAGGAGGSTPGTGTTGGSTIIHWPTPAQNLISIAGGAASGTVASASVGGNGGNGGIAFSSLNNAFSQLAIPVTSNGNNGTPGNATASPAAQVAKFFSGGGGGAGNTSTPTPAAGGNVTQAYSYYNDIIGGAAGSSGAAGGNGADGISVIPADLYAMLSSSAPLFSTGGAGGGSSDTGAGGNGGNGGQCSGGGGGGAGQTTAGNGGRGGDGIAIFVSF